MRIRSIKPEFFKHDELAKLPPLTRLLFQGTWCLADSEGRLEDRPNRIKVEVLPYDDHDVDAGLNALAANGQIIRYTAGGLKLIQVTNFRRHQRITGSEASMPSRFPAPPTETPTPPNRNTSGPPGNQVGNTSEIPWTAGDGKETDGNRETEGSVPDVSTSSPVPLVASKPKIPKDTKPAEDVLAHLNAETGRSFEAVGENLKLITARIESVNGDIEGVKAMVSRQCALWKNDPKMSEYLRPSTLFGKEKFRGYYDMRNEPVRLRGFEAGTVRENLSAPEI